MMKPTERLNQTSSAIAEYIFLAILIWLVAGPLSGAVLSINTWFGSIVTRGSLELESTKNLAKQVLASAERIKTLEAKLAQTQLELTRVSQQSRDANSLRELLSLKTHADRQAIAAEVTARNPDNWFEQVTIDKGKLDHVTINSAVITSAGVVGRVISVSDQASVVQLLTDPEMHLGVLIQRAGVTGILSGRHQSPAMTDFVPIGTNVQINDKVVCLGKGGTFPENHPVGTVIGKRDSNGINARIEVKLAESCYDLSEVLVLPPLEQ
jgi:rod shape-determining protein MreC